MDEILDKDYLDELKVLNIGAGGSHILSVNEEAWETGLLSEERKDNVGCYLLFVFLYILLFTPISGKGFILLIGSYLGLQYKWLNRKKYKNLRPHGKFQFDFYKDRMVRYTDRNYEIIPYAVIEKLEVRRFGIVLFKSKNFKSIFLHPANPDVFVIPIKMQSYPQIKAFLIDTIGE